MDFPCDICHHAQSETFIGLGFLNSKMHGWLHSEVPQANRANVEGSFHQCGLWCFCAGLLDMHRGSSDAKGLHEQPLTSAC
jgi:hypothetical protein